MIPSRQELDSHGRGGLPGSPGTALGPDFALAANLAMLGAFSTVTIAAATALLDKEARLVRLATR